MAFVGWSGLNPLKRVFFSATLSVSSASSADQGFNPLKRVFFSATALAVLFVVILAYSVIMYEALGNTVFVVTNDHIEEKGGLIWKTQHRIPLTYVRDVTYDQNFLQAMFGVSSVTVSPTNGRKIVLSNVPDGERTREIIWNLVLLKSSDGKRE